MLWAQLNMQWYYRSLVDKALVSNWFNNYSGNNSFKTTKFFRNSILSVFYIVNNGRYFQAIVIKMKQKSIIFYYL